MTDVVSTDVRSQMMSSIRSKNTRPEVLLRKALNARGFRYRLHVKGLPGTPDLVFPKHRAVIFVNGCFWHGHGCSLFKWPSTNAEFWRQKITRNMSLDDANADALIQQGWRVLAVWECAMKGKSRLNMEDLAVRCRDWLLTEQQIGEIPQTL